MSQAHVVVTGAGTGIGRAIALRLARDGAAVTLSSIAREELEETAELVEGRSHVAPCDTRDRAAVDRAFADAARTLGPIDALVRLRDRELGSGLRRLRHRPRPRDAASHPVARGDGAGSGRRAVARRLAGGSVAAPGSPGADGARRRARLRADGRIGARVLSPQGDLRGGTRERVCGPDAVRAVRPRLPRARHDVRRAAPARDPERDAGGRDARRDLEGRGVARAAGDQLPLRRRGDDGRQPRRLQERRQGDRLPARVLGQLHGEAVRRLDRQLVPHPLLAPARGRAGVLRGPCVVRPLARRPDRVREGARALLRADGQLVQALCGRELGADDARVGTRQPHLRVPRRRSREGASGRVAHPGRRREPVPRVRGDDRRRAARDRARARGAAGARGERLRVGRGAVPRHHTRRDRGARVGLGCRQDRGRLLYREPRVSAGRTFQLLKLRTVREDVLGRAAGHVRLLDADVANLTWAGKRMLKPLYLDELPQLVNVLRGEMSLVGPRPWPEVLVRRQAERGVDYRLRVQAGWTGPAQVSKGLEAQFEQLDLEYVRLLETGSSWQIVRHDVGILGQTVGTMLRGEGLAY